MSEPSSVTVTDQLWAMILSELCNVPEVPAERRRQVAQQLAEHVAANLDLLEQPSQSAPKPCVACGGNGNDRRGSDICPRCLGRGDEP